MLPSKILNIYPKSEENLKALVSFYFDEYDINQEGAVKMLIDKTSLSLNQLEHILKMISEAFYPIFKKHLKGKIDLTNLIAYGFAAFTQEAYSDSESHKRQMITLEFKHFVEEKNSNL